MANSKEEYSQLVNITPAEVGAAIENQNRIDGVYLIVDTKVQNLLCESILSTLFENALSSPEVASAYGVGNISLAEGMTLGSSQYP